MRCGEVRRLLDESLDGALEERLRAHPAADSPAPDEG